jgi:hypothetical protein
VRKSPPLGLALSVIAGLVIGAAIGGAVVASQAVSFGAIRIDRDVSGVVALVNAPGNAICITEDKTGTQLCSEVLEQPGSPALVVGEHVNVTRIWFSGHDALVLTSAAPTPS